MASRIVGVVLALIGVGFIALPGYVYAIGQLPSVIAVWKLVAILVGIGACCLGAGTYFLRLDVNEPEQHSVSRFAPFFLAHRRELKVTALAGLVVSLVRLVAVCVGVNWPGPAADGLLILAWIGLVAVQSQLDWHALPEHARPPLKAALRIGTAFLWILLLLLVWNQWAHFSFWPTLRTAFAPLLYGWQALVFAYGEPRLHRNTDPIAGAS